jgi:PAS domain S-box-containing protein
MEIDFSRVIDLLPGLVWTALPDGRVDFVNQRWCEYTGLSVDEACGEGWQAAVHPEDRDQLVERWLSMTDADETGELEARLCRSDGEYRWFLFGFSPLADPSGAIVKWCGVNTDIEDRKRAEEAVRLHERRAQVLVDGRWAETLLAGEKRLLQTVAQGWALSDVLETLCRTVEDAAPGCLCSVLSIDPDGVRFRYGAGPSLPAAYNEALDGLVMDRNYGPCGMAANLKLQVIAADVASDPRWQASPWPGLVLGHGLRSCWSTPILSRDDRVIGVFALYQREVSSPDLREQELIRQFTEIASIAIEGAQSDAALRRSEAFLAEGQRLSLTGSFSWRPDTDEITFSDELFRIFEFDADAPVSLERIGERVHAEDIPLLSEMISQARAGADQDYEIRLRMPDGAVKYLHSKSHPIRGQDGRLEYLGAIQDITERRVFEETLSKVRSELAHMARVTSLGALTASIAHEVNQPLSGIITNANTCLKMLAADPPNVAGAQETARRTVRDGNRAADVIKRLRVLFGKQEATSEPVDLNEAVREVIALSWSDLQRSRAVVRSELTDDLPPVIGDRVQLQQVILNLLLNAADAMSGVEERPRLVSIRTEREEEGRVRLTVQDAGVGLDSQAMARLFDAFFTTKNEGMGIGLSISRTIIDNHGGRLWAEPNDGPGAQFAFSVPCAAGAAATVGNPRSEAQPGEPQDIMVKH